MSPVDPRAARRSLQAIATRMRAAIERFVQDALDDPENRERFALRGDRDALARELWQEGLTVAYRTLWRLRDGKDFESGIGDFEFRSDGRRSSSQLSTLPSQLPTDGPAVAGAASMPTPSLASRIPGHREDALTRPTADPFFLSTLNSQPSTLHRLPALERLRDALRWRPGRRGARERIPYERWDVEDFGSLYEALLDREPGIASEPMSRLRRRRVEVVVPQSQGEPYRQGTAATGEEAIAGRQPSAGIAWVEEIPTGRFHLRAGLGRKGSGSYYTPREIVRFLVRETLGPLIAERSPPDDPQPQRLLELKVLDPAMGTGAFLIEACRFLGDAVHAAFRGSESLASCRALVATRCLYGVDRDPFAATLARSGLRIAGDVADDDGLASLQRHLVVGDSLTGAFVEHLVRRPSRPGESIETLDRPELADRFLAAIPHAHPAALRIVAAAWCGNVMRGATATDDAAYADLLEVVARTGELLSAANKTPSPPTPLPRGRGRGEVVSARLRMAIAAGLGLDDVPAETATIAEWLESERCVPALPFEFAFPEVFLSTDRSDARRGFDAVLGNPPWDKSLPLSREFLARYDVAVLAAPTGRERQAIERRRHRDPQVRAAWTRYLAGFQGPQRIVEATYSRQRATVAATGSRGTTGGHGDAYRRFVERIHRVAARDGRVGLVLPNSFYANEGATGVRRLTLHESRLDFCLGFVNSKRLFDVGAGQRFALVGFVCGGPTEAFSASFGATETDGLADPEWRSRSLRIPLALVEATSPEHLCLLEFASQADVETTARLFARSRPFAEVAERCGVRLSQEMNMTTDSPRFSATATVLSRLGLPTDGDPRRSPLREALLMAGWFVVHEKGTFHAWDDGLKSQPRYLCPQAGLEDKPQALRGAAHFRLALRATIHASEADKSVACLLPPGVVVGNSALVERSPGERPPAFALALAAILNSRPFGHVAKRRLGTNMNLFLLGGLPTPPLDAAVTRFLAHAALRLTCRHAAYADLWREQLGDRWREPSRSPFEWPAVAGDEARAALRAAVDAVVANAYGLSLDEYAHVLDGFADAPGMFDRSLGLALFDELERDGLERFGRTHDPYWG